jgi:uncharacterized membrane protein
MGMTTFTVWKYDDPDGAEQAASILRGAASDGIIKVLDHAVVSWPVGDPHPRTKHSHEDTWTGTTWGAFIGLAVGALFAVPLLGVAAGAGVGALYKISEGIGITKEDLDRIRSQITEGTSALFVVTDQGDLDRVAERFHGMHTTLVDSNLTEPEREAVLEAFGKA